MRDGEPWSARRLLRHLRLAWELCWRAGPWLSAVQLAASVLTGLLPATIAWLTKLVIDGLVAGRPSASVLGWAVGLAAAGLVLAVEPRFTMYVRSEQARRIDRVVQDRLYTAVDGFQGLSRFENPRFLDKLRMATHADGTAISPVTTGMFSTGRGVITLVSLFVTLYLLSPVVAAIVLVGTLPALAMQIRLSRQRMHMFAEQSPAHRRQFFYASLLTDVQAAKEIRLFGLGDFLKGRLLDGLRGLHAQERRFEWRELRIEALLSLLSAGIAAGGLVWAIWAAANGTLGVGDVSAFIAAVSGTQAGLALLVGSIASAHGALLMFAHHVDVTDLPDDLERRGGPASRALPALRDSIELRDVWFRYDDTHPWVLRGVNLTIPYGKATAIVGLNGAGKSTLVKLLCRLYDPTRGTIHWDGTDIRDVPPSDLRRRMGVLFQDFMAYDLTATENIGIGDLDVHPDRQRVEAAARTAGAHSIVQGLPSGYDTLLSRIFFTESEKDDPDSGVELSGGQWQRLALARTFMRDQRDLLILDEPSAGLDARAEQEIHQRLRQLRAGRTSLLISHRLSAIRDADQIVVLVDGGIRERGCHSELIRSRGAYAELFTLQASGYGGAPAGNTG